MAVTSPGAVSASLAFKRKASILPAGASPADVKRQAKDEPGHADLLAVVNPPAISMSSALAHDPKSEVVIQEDGELPAPVVKRRSEPPIAEKSGGVKEEAGGDGINDITFCPPMPEVAA